MRGRPAGGATSLPFTVAQFLDTFARHTTATWPAQWGLGALAAGAVAAAWPGAPGASRIAAGVVGLLWLSSGAVYHIGFFRAINPAAALFGAPCPVVIFTFGPLAWRTARVPWWLLFVAVLWAAVGTMAALQLGMREDLGLLVAAIPALALIARRTGRRGDAASARKWWASL